MLPTVGDLLSLDVIRRGSPQAVGARDHLRAAPANHVQREQVANRGKHMTQRKARNQDAYTVSVHTDPRDRKTGNHV